MPKYKPEKSKDKYERGVNDLDRKAKDRTKHMSNVVKNDAKVIKDFSRNIKSGGTIEGKKKFKEAAGQTGKEVGKEVKRQYKDLEDIVKHASEKKGELEQGIKYSKLNYAELTKVSDNIKESTAARKMINQGRQAAQKDTYTLESLRNNVSRTLRRTMQQGQDLVQEFKKTRFYAPVDSAKLYLDSEVKREEGREVDNAIKQLQKNSIEEVQNNIPEGQIIAEKDQDHELCPRAKKKLGKLSAVNEELEEKLKDVPTPQDKKQPAAEPEKKHAPNYGRPPVVSGRQNDIYNQEDKYE